MLSGILCAIHMFLNYYCGACFIFQSYQGQNQVDTDLVRLRTAAGEILLHDLQR